LNSKTKGINSKKVLVIFKSKEEDKNDFRKINEINLELLNELSIQKLENYDLELTKKEHENILQKIQKPNSNPLYDFYRNFNNLSNKLTAKIPQKRKQTTNNLQKPIQFHRQDIINLITHNRIVIINGEKGMGKTTQIGQYILDSHSMMNQKCCIIHSLPTDLMVYCATKKVCEERSEQLGETVGYQLYLNQKETITSNTLLTFCNNQILLKTLINSNNLSCFNSITHIILDEIDLRSTNSDFILLAIKDIIFKFKNIKFIMCSNIPTNIELFQKYFNHCPFISMPLYMADSTIQEYYLDDILINLKLKYKLKSPVINDDNNKTMNVSLLEEWCTYKRKNSYIKINQKYEIDLSRIESELAKTNFNIVDDLLEKGWKENDSKLVLLLINLIENQKINGNSLLIGF
jgi:hypothetical protein